MVVIFLPTVLVLVGLYLTSNMTPEWIYYGYTHYLIMLTQFTNPYFHFIRVHGNIYVICNKQKTKYIVKMKKGI